MDFAVSLVSKYPGPRALFADLQIETAAIAMASR
jgi:hypothetical protein